MSVLRTIEQKIEGLFEGIFGRAFRAHVQPVELARKLAKEMDDHRTVSVSRIYAPNEYTIYLSEADRSQFASYEESLVGELQDYLAEHGRREGHSLLSPPRVLLRTDEDLSVGEFGIATRLVQPEGGPASPAPALTTPEPELEPSATMLYKARGPEPEVEAEPPPVEREVVTLEVEGREIVLTQRHVVLGRAQECDIRLADANVSRRHAELRQEDATYWLVDLGSTNGTLLNDEAVQRAKLSDGDRITLGETVAVFRRALP
jgi:hypothetical protein